METQYRAGDDLVRPDEVSLCAVLNAWASCAEYGGANRAIQIYEHMKSISSDERGFSLSIMMPNIVIKAIARSNDPDGVEKAEKILEDLERSYEDGSGNLQPDVTTYSSVINCCAYYRYSEKRKEALEAALRTFDKVRKMDDEVPNNITFGTLLKAVAKLMADSDEKEEMVRKLFDEVR
jgi:hypothetical protein